MVNIEDLIARVKALSGGDRKTDRELGKISGFSATTFSQYEPADVMPRYTSSVDAALAFADRVLPGCEVRMERHPYGPCHAEIWERGNRYGIWSQTLPIAIILATLKAKVAE